MSTGLLKIQSLHDFIKNVYNLPVLRFCYGKLFAVAFKFRECYSPKFDVTFQKSLFQHSETRLTRIFLQKNYVSSCVTPLSACANVISFLQ